MTNNEALKIEFDYYKENQDELVRKYQGKFLVIKDRQVQGVYDSEIEAYQAAQKKFILGSFLIQLVKPGEGSYTQTFYSRVTI